jgi:putative tryptophan/tyrosine transport system substrate-binding protein
MRRREFITLVSGATVTWPLAARAQQQTVPVVEFLRPTRAVKSLVVAAVRQGLRESGYSNDKVAIEFRWGGDGREDRLPKLAAELVALQVSAIVGASVPATRAAKAATASIPIIFVVGVDPVAAGLVSSLNRPGGNVTGVSFYDVPITGKRLALLRELVPKADIIAVLQDRNAPGFEMETREIEATARTFGQKIATVKAASEQEIDAAFSTITKSGAIPTSYVFSGFVASGGLVSYGASQTDTYHVLAFTSPAFSRERSRATFRLSYRPNMSWSSTSRRPRRSTSPCLPRCLLAPTR